MDLRTIIVCGSRDGQPWADINLGMRAASTLVPYEAVMVGRFEYKSEQRYSTDKQVALWVLHEELVVTIVPARWKTGGRERGEGPIRNRRMAKLAPHFLALLPNSRCRGSWRRLNKRVAYIPPICHTLSCQAATGPQRETGT